MYRNVIKRLMDLTFAILMFILLSPVFIVVMLLLLVVNDGKPFFIQKRPGKDEKIFKIIKFKTMNDRKDMKGNLLPDDVRLTTVGSFVRKTSLDEIPQFINVIKGDMSFIGPRPLLVHYLDLYNDEQKLRHTVRPGITGWAQVNGRNTITWTKKFELDIYYVKNLSFILDLKIIVKTIRKVLLREGVSQEGQATVQAFNGHN